VTDLVTQQSAGVDGRLRLDLQPYELRSFAAGGAGPVVERGSVRADAEFVRGLEAQMRAAESRAAADPHLQMARDCLSRGRYARLFRLLQESWNRSR
jgi:hypothetical protein